jgi:RecJ-like exonuclease
MGKILQEALSNFTDKISDSIKSNKKILVTTHMDCDGITSGSIITKALFRAGAKCTVRTTNEFSHKLIDKMQKETRDLHIITDLGGGFGRELDEKLEDSWIVLDHHEIPDDEIDNNNIINSWKFGFDGGVEICAGGMTYLASVALQKENQDLSSIAIISALGDRQDQGEKKSFTGKNMEIAKTAQRLGLVKIDLDLLLVGRETRPLPDALAFTSQPFIEGLTWNRSACLSILNSAGIQLKEGARWRVTADLDQDEKRTIIESITKFAQGKNSTQIMEDLIGFTYTFPREDKRSFLRDGREFSTMLNSCGRINRSGVGISICMGDRNKMLQEGESTLVEYRGMLRNYMNVLSNERWRVNTSKNYVMVNGEGLVPETMTGTVTSLVAGSPKNAGKIVILRTDGAEGTIKFSSRKSMDCKSDVNLSKLMRNGAEKFDGIGGGHNAAAGAKITKDKLDEFLDYIEENVNKLQTSDINQ